MSDHAVMGRTGARADSLVRILEREGMRRTQPPRPARLNDVAPDVVGDLRELYLAWGGEPELFDQLRPGGWDLAFENGVLVELDEQQHFNRYRADTLARPWAASMPWAEPYIGYCRDLETQCLRYGKGQGRWTSPSSERFFGAARGPGDFAGVGSPRWRQRALYDAIRDACAPAGLARLAVHDLVDGRPLDAILRSSDLTAAPNIRDLVMARSV